MFTSLPGVKHLFFFSLNIQTTFCDRGAIVLYKNLNKITNKTCLFLMSIYFTFQLWSVWLRFSMFLNAHIFFLCDKCYYTCSTQGTFFFEIVWKWWRKLEECIFGTENVSSEWMMTYYFIVIFKRTKRGFLNSSYWLLQAFFGKRAFSFKEWEI